MNKLLVTIFLFVAIVVFVTSPFAALAFLMLGLLIAAFSSTLWTLLEAFVSEDPKKHSSS